MSLICIPEVLGHLDERLSALEEKHSNLKITVPKAYLKKGQIYCTQMSLLQRIAWISICLLSNCPLHGSLSQQLGWAASLQKNVSRSQWWQVQIKWFVLSGAVSTHFIFAISFRRQGMYKAREMVQHSNLERKVLMRTPEEKITNFNRLSHA